MKKTDKIISYVLYLVLSLSSVVVAFMGYGQVMTVRSEASADLATWLSKQQALELMRFHGTDVLKVTTDGVFISRNSTWIPVMKRDRG